MKTLNVMDIAWRLYRKLNIKFFSIALKRAWVIVKRTKMIKEFNNILYITAKTASSKKTLRDVGFTYERNQISFVEDYRNMNLFYEVIKG